MKLLLQLSRRARRAPARTRPCASRAATAKPLPSLQRPRPPRQHRARPSPRRPASESPRRPARASRRRRLRRRLVHARNQACVRQQEIDLPSTVSTSSRSRRDRRRRQPSRSAAPAPRPRTRRPPRTPTSIPIAKPLAASPTRPTWPWLLGHARRPLPCVRRRPRQKINAILRRVLALLRHAQRLVACSARWSNNDHVF